MNEVLANVLLGRKLYWDAFSHNGQIIMSKQPTMHIAGMVQTLQQRWLRVIMIYYGGWWKQRCHHFYNCC